MKLLNMTQRICKLAYFCLASAIDLEDELLKAESLALLHGLVMRADARQVIEDMMIEHYYHTQYDQARKMMLNSFIDLQHVEKKNKNLTITVLYEDILSLF
jgi:hypothetical protein